MNNTLGETMDMMRDPSIPVQVYNSCGSRLTRMSQNLFSNWMHVKEAIQELPRLSTAHKDLRKLHDTVEVIYQKALANESILDGFQDDGQITTIEALLETLIGNIVIDGGLSEEGEQVQHLSTEILSLIQGWKTFVTGVKVLKAEAEGDRNLAVFNIIDNFLLEVRELGKLDTNERRNVELKEEKRLPPATRRVEDDKLKKKTLAVGCLSIILVDIVRFSMY
jgi:hypothetical protein